MISQVHSALEFYGHSQLRERELEAVQKRLESLFNSNQDQSLSVHFLAEGVPCVVQHGEKYHRVVIKHRESETRVLVKLVDRGDEIIVDTSELLQLESNYCSIPSFAQPFRLHGFDESQSNAQITRKLKRLLLNQRVHLTQHLPAINGFYPVEVRLPDNLSLAEVLLSTATGEKQISPPIRDLPAPQKLLTASVNRAQPGRFTPETTATRNGFAKQQENNGPRPRAFPDRPVGNGFAGKRSSSLSLLSTSSLARAPPRESKPAFDAGAHFPPSALPGDASLTFVLSHIESLSDFFIQLLSKGAELSKLTETLQRACHLAPEVTLASLKIDQACLAKSVDQCWYRAEVLSTGITKVKVRFVDFGDTLDVERKDVRLLEKKFCATSPYAYRCTLKEEISGTMKISELSEQCAGKEFHGRLLAKSSDQQRFLLQSEDFQVLLRPAAGKRGPCELVYIDFDQQQFFLQENPSLMNEIRTEVEQEFQSNASPTAVRCSTLVLCTFDETPYRARVLSLVDEEHVQVYFIDYGNSSTCEKSALKTCSEKLQGYPPQARACRLSGVTKMDLEELEEYLDGDGLEVCRVEGNEVLLYQHGRCLQPDEHSTTGTTVKEQERPTNKRNNEQIFSPPSVSANHSLNVKRKKSESEGDVYHQGTLTHLDPQRPLLYLQLLPHSESRLAQINTLIAKIVEKNERPSNYQVGDAVIAQFTEDNNHYRARIHSHSSARQCYTVEFIDYGNTDSNVKEEQLFAYSKELEEIEGQARLMRLETIDGRLRAKLEKEKVNDLLEFRYLNEENALIELRLDDDDDDVQTFTANISGSQKDSFYVHLLPEGDSLICEMSELIDQHRKEHLGEGKSWSVGDLCIVFDGEEDQYFRGRILSSQFDVQCIDYGKVLFSLSVEHLYVLKTDEVLRRSPLARQCRLFGVNDEKQVQAIQQVIEQIEPNELVTITVQSKDDDGCLRVMLFRENNDIVNDLFQDEKDSCPPSNSSDSAIAADGDHSTSSNPGDVQLTSPIGVPQAESTHQYGDTTNATLNNQTIDFGENDPSTSTTLIDEP